MTYMRHHALSTLAALGIFTLSATVSHAQQIFTIGGSNDPASIQSEVDLFRAALGDPLNGNTPGPLANGRREINWDGGGSTATTVSPTPFNGFQNTRGGSFSTPGTDFVQAPPSGLATQVGNATYETIFTPFSNARIFTPIGSNIMDVTFSIPGTGGATLATVSGFGAVFSDVDLADTTRLDFFGLDDSLLTSQVVAPGTVADGSLSFLGVNFDTDLIARVRITTGNSALGPNDDPNGGVDVVVMDDFFYSEPQGVVPEPGTTALLRD
jgi:hypothetical protein